jgi:hypothetical protein
MLSASPSSPVKVNLADLKKIAISRELTHDSIDGSFEFFYYSTAVRRAAGAASELEGTNQRELQGPKTQDPQPSRGQVSVIVLHIHHLSPPFTPWSIRFYLPFYWSRLSRHVVQYRVVMSLGSPEV